MKHLRLCVLAALLACSRSRDGTARGAGAGAASELGTAAGAASEPGTAAASARGAASATSSASATGATPPMTTSTTDGGAECPGGMVLVDGDYCTRLELVCKESWYASWNAKTICNEFEKPSKCVGGRVKKRFCIDAFEYPNKKGARPEVGFDFVRAQRLCAAQSKRVCTETEWTTACEGPEYKPFPYGYVRAPKACNGDRPYIAPVAIGHDQKGSPFFAFASKNAAISRAEFERLWQGVESGTQPECVSDYGVWDMTGNADELAASETSEPVSPFDNVTTGGPWLYGVRNQCRPKIYTHNEGFAYYYLSTRCCAEADGAATDPRSPKQIERRYKWRP